MKEYIATFETGIQITENSFTVINPTIKINSETKISELEDFYRKSNQKGQLQLKIIGI